MRAIISAAALLACSAVALSPGLAQDQWRKGYFPNVPLVTQDGRKVRFYDDVVKGKVVAINFIYTSCGDVCPLDTAALRRVQKLLGDRVGRDIYNSSLTIDPKTDTPPVLKKYMQTFGVGPGWTFLTGRPQDIDLIQKKLGIKPAVAGKLNTHDTRFILGNEAIARWVKRTPHDNPHVLAHILTRDLPTRGSAGSKAPLRSYAQVPRVEGMTEGETLFMSRCSACHSIGGGDARLGPDLAGVTDRRQRAWLLRRIKEPDKMRAEKDPATMAVVARYRSLPMPNLRLSNAEVSDIVDYLDAENKRLKAHGGHHVHGQ